MPQHLRDVTTDDLPAITAIYRDSVLNRTASYEITPPDLKEMTARFHAIREKGYPYIAAIDDAGVLIGFTEAGNDYVVSGNCCGFCAG